MPIVDSPAILAAQHMLTNRRNLQTVTHNIANVSTVGYQGEKAIVTEYQPSKNFMSALSFAVNNKNHRDVSAGEFQATGNALDIAIGTPDVYLAVQGANNEKQFTRNGHLELNQDRQLIQTTSRLPVTDANFAPIVIPAGMNNISIAEDGTVSANGQVLATIGVFKFAESQSLTKTKDTLMKSSTDPTPATDYQILQGGVEGSNVSAVLAMAQLIDLQRQDTQDTHVINTYREQSGQQIESLLQPLKV